MSVADHEAALVEAAKAGSDAAFSALVERHQQTVRAFLRKLAGNGDADDLAQEAFLTAWENLSRFETGTSLRAWLCRIGYNKYLTAQRGRARRVVREEAYVAMEGVATPSGDDRLDLSAALARLPVEQRAAVTLCLAAGFTHAEAASTLDLPLGTVKSHVTRGKAKLMEALGDDFG